MLIFLITLIYVGSVVNPLGHLSGLPVLVVNEDAGATAGGSTVQIGAQVAGGLQNSRAANKSAIPGIDDYDQATKELSNNAAYAAIIIPPDFSASVLSLYGLHRQLRDRP